uniref:(northern house mosquito) hypothetical protein n=1 Tax=Culex pipiens TaxID=7175 RepID=A0A8D8CP76_CULPI
MFPIISSLSAGATSGDRVPGGMSGRSPADRGRGRNHCPRQQHRPGRLLSVQLRNGQRNPRPGAGHAEALQQPRGDVRRDRGVRLRLVHGPRRNGHHAQLPGRR